MSSTWVADALPALAAVSFAVSSTAAAAFRPRLRARLPALTLLAAAVSLAVTLAHVVGAVEPAPGTGALGMAEGLALAALAGLVVRYAPPRR
ncbi:hypothetical protein, partial [Nonomuraea sp. JJY05]|uniref:hypothetical protein n=1 Tax=Nonomuraea sp. JJY05 TaxID=3350255 RepID=UPI00373F294E